MEQLPPAPANDDGQAGEPVPPTRPGQDLEPARQEPVLVRPLGAAPDHRYRFRLVYLALGALLAAAISGVAIIATQPGKPKPGPWASWVPASGSTDEVSAEIAAHVSRQYRLSSTGGQLVAVLAGAPEIVHGIKTTDVSEIALCDSLAAQRCSSVISSKGTIEEQFCGLSTNCSTTEPASSTSTRLLRREALEIALYTFKYAHGVDRMIAFLPPAPGALPSTVLYLERDSLQKQLSEPLAKTLPLQTPPDPRSLDGAEAATIDHLTLPAEFQFNYVAISKTADAIVLAPGAA